MKIGAVHFSSGFRPRIGVRGVLSPESPMALRRPRKGMKMVGRRTVQTGRAAPRALSWGQQRYVFLGGPSPLFLDCLSSRPRFVDSRFRVMRRRVDGMTRAGMVGV